MHTCHNRQCVNPNHLKFGTAKENSDMDIRRNHAGNIYNKGEAHPKARLTEKDIKRVFELKDTLNQGEIGKIFKVSRHLIGKILKRERWSHVKL